MFCFLGIFLEGHRGINSALALFDKSSAAWGEPHLSPGFDEEFQIANERQMSIKMTGNVLRLFIFSLLSVDATELIYG